MKLIVGLGNPGPRYEATRHNAGFLVVDALAEKHGIALDSEKFAGVVGQGQLLNESCLFLKPMTFMNLSGRSVAQAARFYKIPVEDIIVIYDDVDVAIGSVKGRLGGGPGGHNGIRSMIAELGNPEFHRVKVGVGKPPKEWKIDTADWVLGKLTTDEVASYRGPILDEVVLRLRQIFLQKNGKAKE